ncbi:MAG: hypothetical protein QME49_05245, partial [bacterium]|nr:hypothetical protein [bacterium]
FVWEGENIVKSKDFYFYAYKDNEQKAKEIIRSQELESKRQEAENKGQNNLQEINKNDKMPVVLQNRLWLICSVCFFAGMSIALMILKIVESW